MSDKPADILLSAAIGDSLVLATQGSQRSRELRLLNPTAAWIWQASRAGLAEHEIAAHLAERFGIPPEQARADVLALLRECDRMAELRPAPSEWTLAIADRKVRLVVDDPAAAAFLARVTAHLRVESSAPFDSRGTATALAQGAPPTANRQRPTDDIPLLHLDGSASDWHLSVNGVSVAQGDTIDSALSLTIDRLADAGCARDRRLLVLHAAAVARAGQAIVLTAPGGSGKTTLACALNASGWDLLGDDVVPVSMSGELLGTGLAPCIKSGSWAALAPFVPGLDEAPTIERAGVAVRYPRPPGAVARGPLPTAAFIVPRFAPGEAADVRALSPVDLLRAIVDSDSVIPTLDQQRLEKLAAWIASAPGFAIRYPDLESALRMVREVLAPPPACPSGSSGGDA